MDRRVMSAVFGVLSTLFLNNMLSAQIDNFSFDSISKVSDNIISDTSLQFVYVSQETISKNFESSCNGIEVVGFYDEDTLRRISYSVGLSDGLLVFNFFIFDKNHVYITERKSRFKYDEVKQEFNTDKMETSFNGKYLFLNDSIHAVETIGHNRFEDESIKYEVLLDEFYSFKQMLMTKK